MRCFQLFAIAALSLVTCCQNRQSGGGLESSREAKVNPPSDERDTLDVYERVARDTNGLAVRMNRSELARDGGASAIAELATAALEADEDLWSEEGRLRGKKALEFAIDSSVTLLVVTISGVSARPKVLLTDPSGTQLDASHRKDVGSSVLLRVSKPTSGLWRLALDADDNVAVRVQAASNVSFHKFHFVRPRGRPGHGGLLDYSGPLNAGAIEKAAASLSEVESRPLKFTLLSREGHALSTAKQIGAQNSPAFGRAKTEQNVLLEVSIPEQEFRVLVEGTLANGQAFQRLYRRLFVPGKATGSHSFRMRAERLATENECQRLSYLSPSFILDPSDEHSSARANCTVYRESKTTRRELSLSLSVAATADSSQPRTLRFVTPEFRHYAPEECKELLGLLSTMPNKVMDGAVAATWAASCEGGRARLDVTLRRGE